jgi:mono/diheme cytochrome c family protein
MNRFHNKMKQGGYTRSKTALGSTRLRPTLALAAAVVIGGWLGGCADQGPQPWALTTITQDYTFPARDAAGKIVKGGVVVSAEVLNRGREAYVHYCYACHGMDGDGKGPSSYGLRPPPRNFKKGNFKFGAVSAGQLPSDADLMRIVKGGLHGTAMLAWDIPDGQLGEIIQFIKTFPGPDGKDNRWQKKYTRGKKAGQLKAKIGELIATTPDPWAGKDAAAVQKGEELYHLKAQCWTCHATYMTKQGFSDLALKIDGKAKTSFRPNMYESKLVEAKDLYGVDVLPPDFTIDKLRSVRKGSEMVDLHRVISAGVGKMPAWTGSLPEKEIWALVHYVRSLQLMAQPENRAKRNALYDKLAKQPKFTPPPPPPPPAPADAEGDEAGDKKAGDKKAGDKKAGDTKADQGGDKKAEAVPAAPAPAAPAPAAPAAPAAPKAPAAAADAKPAAPAKPAATPAAPKAPAAP